MNKGRFLLATWDGAGNLPPEFALARELVSRGHAVDVLVHDTAKTRVESEGCLFLRVENAPQFDIAGTSQPEDEIAFFVENCWFARGYGTDVGTAVQNAEYDFLLVDGCLAHGIAAALASGLPTAVLWHSLYSLFVTGPFAGLFDSMLGAKTKEIEQYGVGPFQNYRQFVETTSRVLVLSYAPFDVVPGELSDRVTHVGPFRPVPADGRSWPRRYTDRSLAVVGLSTSNQGQIPFLQRMCDAFDGLDIECLVTTGAAIDPSSLRTPENVTAVGYLPHEAVLPQTDLLITHAGHGTVMAGVTYGVPMLCIPMGRDQPFVAARVEDLGLGQIAEQTATVEALRKRIKTTIEDKRLRSRCQSFAAALADHPGLGRAVEILEA